MKKRLSPAGKKLMHELKVLDQKTKSFSKKRRLKMWQYIIDLCEKELARRKKLKVSA